MKLGILFSTAVVILWVTTLVLLIVNSTSDDPRHLYGPCHLAEIFGPNVFVCEKNLHAYHLQHGKLVDMGPLTPSQPAVPSR